jgi:hypothetical protein
MHWTLVMVAYNVVEMSSGAARESFRAQQRAVRDAITPAEWIRHDRRPA